MTVTGPDLGIPGLEEPSLIGSGGFGSVYRARQARLGRDVAVKVLPGAALDEAALRRFDREARAIGRLSNHPNIVTVYDSGQTDFGQPFLVMEHVGNGSAADLLDRDGPLPWPRALRLAVGVCGALATSHAAGILHRDVKPENILLSDFGEPMLCDFGIARHEGSASSTVGLAGTVAHLAPELLEGEVPDAATDLYALGSTLFELLHGSPAFVRATDPSVAPVYGRILNDPVPDLRGEGVPDEVCAYVERLMAKDPAARPASARDAGEAAQTLLHDAGEPVPELVVAGAPQAAPGVGAVGARTPVASTDPGRGASHAPTDPATAPPSAPRRRTALAAAGALTLALVAAVGVWAATRPTDASGDPTASPSEVAGAPQIVAAGGAACAAVAASDPDSIDADDVPVVGTVGDLLETLAAGETGCLAGRFVETVTLVRGGETDAPLTLAPLDGAEAVIEGAIRVPDAVHDVVLRGLTVEAQIVPGVVIDGDRVTLEDSEVTSARGTCIYVGSSPATLPRDVVIRRNRIHACGPDDAEQLSLFAISAGFTRGLAILDNAIWDVAQRGIVLYPDTDNATVSRNTLHAVGIPFDLGGNATEGTTANTVIERNVVSEPAGLWLKGTWEDVAGEGLANVALGNCLSAPTGAEASPTIEARDTVEAVVTFADVEAGDLTLAEGSPCEGLGAPLEVAAPPA